MAEDEFTCSKLVKSHPRLGLLVVYLSGVRCPLPRHLPIPVSRAVFTSDHVEIRKPTVMTYLSVADGHLEVGG